MAIGIILLVVILFGLIKFRTLKQLHFAMTIFNENKIVENFMNIKDNFPTRKILKSPNPTSLKSNLIYQLPSDFEWKNEKVNLEEYINYARTTGLTIIANDTVVYADYKNGMQESTPHISWSVSKSIVSALVGIALDEKLFDNIEDPITKYLPQFINSAYDGVRIKDILQMSTGVGFNEDYRDFNSDINRFGRHFAIGKSLEDFALGLKRVREPGTYHHYVSLNTQVLGILIVKVTGKSLCEYLKEKIWDPLGMQDDAHWVIDETGMEMALGGLNVSLRDYAKFGLLYARNGDWFGNQIIPKQWVESSFAMDGPHLQPGHNPASHDKFGYGLQWWRPEFPKGDYFACGIYNQFIYIHTAKNLVITKTSANHHFKEQGDDSKAKHVAMFQRIAEDFTSN